MPANDWMWGKSTLDAAYSGMDRGYNNTGHGALRTADDIVRDRNAGTGITATSRASNGNGGNNFISSPSGTDWAKTFGRNAGSSFASVDLGTRQSAMNGSQQKPFSFDLSPQSDRSQTNLGTDASDFYRDRAANMDLTSKDHELYGAGSGYGY